jgi:hypothetical protein
MEHLSGGAGLEPGLVKGAATPKVVRMQASWHQPVNLEGGTAPKWNDKVGVQCEVKV